MLLLRKYVIMSYPDWVLRHRQKGTEIRKIGNNYYLYKIRSEWDREKKRPKKVTEKYLGKITPEGLIKPKHERKAELAENIAVKEFGATNLILSTSNDIINLLKQNFPHEWKEIAVFAIIRLLHQTPIKNVQDYYETSHLSDVFKARVSPKSVSRLLDAVGKNRHKAVKFMRNFVEGSEFAVIDLTHVFSSQNIISSALGYNSEGEYLPQVNLAVIFSLDKKQPVFYRMLPGCVRDVTVMLNTLSEAGVDAVLIGDKGFYSRNNIEFLEGSKLRYILPLRRNSTLIDYSVMEKDKSAFDYFVFNKRVIWYYEREVSGRRIIVYLDEKLRSEEERCFILHVEEGKKDIQEFYEKQHRFGTIAVITNTEYDPSRVFELLKSRSDVEIVFDTFKNLLRADRSYLRDDYKMQGWMFINFVSLLIYYRIYLLLLEKGLLKRYSVRDVLAHLSRIFKLRIDGEWVLSEVPRKTRKLVERLEIELDIT